MSRKTLLRIDAFVNLFLSGLLMIFPLPAARWMGLPVPGTLFYVNILGAVFLGIALGLAWESSRGRDQPDRVGLGVVGAAAINLSGGMMLAGWLIAGGLTLTLAGGIFLWTLVIFLIGISSVELSLLWRRPER